MNNSRRDLAYQFPERISSAVSPTTRKFIRRILPNSIADNVARRINNRNLATSRDVDSCYRILLGREPDLTGLRHYSELVMNNKLLVGDLFELFVRSPEFQNRLQSVYGWSSKAPELVNLLSGYSIYVASSGDESISGAIREKREYEPFVTNAIKSHLSPGDCFVDIGASLGFYSILAGRAVGPSGKVIACEPGVQNQSLLLLNIHHNQLTNVAVHSVAISETSEILAYTRFSSNGAITDFDGNPRTLDTCDLVRAVPLDYLLEREERIDVVKIDVEGAEGRVIRSAQAILTKHRPTLFFEFTPNGLLDVSGISGEDFLDSLTSMGYSFKILSSTDESPSQMSNRAPNKSSDILEYLAESGRTYLDLIATP